MCKTALVVIYLACTCTGRRVLHLKVSHNTAPGFNPSAFTACTDKVASATPQRIRSRRFNIVSSSVKPSQSGATLAEDDAGVDPEGASLRRKRLDEALAQLGFPSDGLIRYAESPTGRTALRAYQSFVMPKSAEALANANSKSRVHTIAATIVKAVQEAQEHAAIFWRKYNSSMDVLAARTDRPCHPLILVLDDLRSAANVGNLLRLAEASMLEQVIFCGMTPSPPKPNVLKAAGGTAEKVPFRVEPDVLQCVKGLQEQGYEVLAAETTSRSVSFAAVSAVENSGDATAGVKKKRLALVLGNELVGVRTSVLEECDRIVSVPTFGFKNSLNVATCASILVYDVLRQWGSLDNQSL